MAKSSDLDIDLSTLSPQDRYKILCGVVVPRPIAWVTTVSAGGIVNAAPYSFFNVFSEDPPLIVLGLQRRPDGRRKDTTQNILDSGEFIVNLVDQQLAESMSDSAIDFPMDVSEPSALMLALLPSSKVKPPRLADAPFGFECRRQVSLAFGSGRELLVGEVLSVHARAGLLDPDTLHINLEKYRPVGRLFGDLYSRQTDIFAIERKSFESWKKR